jgi:hypothetical protein
LKKAAKFLLIPLWNKRSANNPPLPPFEKEGPRGDSRGLFQKARFMKIFFGIP